MSEAMNESPLDPIALALIEDGCEPEFDPAYVRFVVESLLDDEYGVGLHRILMDTCHQVMLDLHMQANRPVQGEAMHKIMAGEILEALRRYWLGEEQ